MKRWHQDALALTAFVAVGLLGLWLWTGSGPRVWLDQFAMWCG